MPKGKKSKTMEVLSKLRGKFAQSNKFEFQQANAHLSMAYTLKIAPEPFELKPWFPIPTVFFKDHKDEVFEVMAQKLSFAWLDNFVSPRFNMENSIKCRNYHDFLMNTERKYSSEFSRLYSKSYNQSQKEGLEEEYHQLISKYNDLERENGSYARQKAQKIDNKWNEVLHRRREIFSKYDFSKHKIIATKELDEYLKVPCKTSWICICDYAVGKLCWERSGIRRNRKTIYRDPDESYCPGGPGVWREFHGKAFDLINPKKYLIDVIEKFLKPTYLSTNEAQENYPEFVVRPDLLESRLFTIKKYLERLDELPDFGESVVSLYKDSENEVRSKYGIPLIGEGWVQEAILFNKIKSFFPSVDVIKHGKPKWLGRQHFDIWVPTHNLAIEYHGKQHFEPVSFFGGKESFEKNIERDERKRGLSEKNRVILVEISYNDDLSEESIIKKLLQKGIPLY